MESKVLKLINEIKVPKSQYNSFGKYNFRNNEDIQTALKPLLLQYGLMEKAYTQMIEMNGELAYMFTLIFLTLITLTTSQAVTVGQLLTSTRKVWTRLKLLGLVNHTQVNMPTVKR